jgi:hypothetical protein
VKFNTEAYARSKILSLFPFWAAVAAVVGQPAEARRVPAECWLGAPCPPPGQEPRRQAFQALRNLCSRPPGRRRNQGGASASDEAAAVVQRRLEDGWIATLTDQKIPVRQSHKLKLRLNRACRWEPDQQTIDKMTI